MAEDNQADYGINAPESRTYIWLGSTFASTFPDRTAARDAHFCLPHLRPSMRVLDCGCGPGSITVGLADAVRPGEVVGIDMQAAEIAWARALAGNRTPRLGGRRRSLGPEGRQTAGAGQVGAVVVVVSGRGGLRCILDRCDDTAAWSVDAPEKGRIDSCTSTQYRR